MVNSEKKGMDSNQWAWLYHHIKGFIKNHEGHTPDEQAVSDFWKLHGFIMAKVANSDKKKPGTDEQLSALFTCLISIIQSLELEKKPL